MKYSEYLQTPHWQDLRDKFIYSNTDAKCWIDGKTSTLLPHHVKYQNLWHERKFRLVLWFATGDIVVVCFDCHTDIHFIDFHILLWPVHIRLPRKKFWLIKRMLYLKIKFCMQNRRYGLMLFYLLACIMA